LVATLSRARDSRNATRLSTTDPLLAALLCGTPVARPCGVPLRHLPDRLERRADQAGVHLL